MLCTALNPVVCYEKHHFFVLQLDFIVKRVLLPLQVV